MQIGPKSSDIWLWRFIIVMILGLLVYLPIIIFNNGSFDQLLSQLQNQVTPVGVQLEVNLSDPLIGVAEVKIQVNTTKAMQLIEEASSSDLFDIESCLFVDQKLIDCENIQESLSVLNNSNYTRSIDVLLPDSARMLDFHYEYTISASSKVLSSFTSNVETLIWEPTFEIREARGDVLDIQDLESSSVYILVSRNENLSVVLDDEVLKPQKMVSPEEIEELSILSEDVALHTWLLVVPDVKEKKNLCFVNIDSESCVELMIKTETQSSELKVSEKNSLISITYDQPRFTLIDLNDSFVLFVYFVHNQDLILERLYLEVITLEGDKIPVQKSIHDSKSAYYVDLESDMNYQFVFRDINGNIRRVYELDTSDKSAQVTDTRFSAELEDLSNTSIDSIGSLILEWDAISQTRYDSETRVYTDLSNGSDSFTALLKLQSLSDEELVLNLNFPAQSLNIRKDILANEVTEIPLTIEDLSYGDHEIIIDVEYSSVKAAPSVYNFRYLPSQSIYERDKQVVLLGLALVVFLSLGCAFFRQSER